jgi:DNA-binding transcriptional ArsR family regulator
MMRLGNAAAVFAALGDDTRLHLVARLSSGGPQSIVALTDAVDVSRQAVTKHLVALEEAGLVRSEKAGRERIWELDTRRLGDAQRYLDEISSQWDRAVDRLRAFVETDD